MLQTRLGTNHQPNCYIPAAIPADAAAASQTKLFHLRETAANAALRSHAADSALESVVKPRATLRQRQSRAKNPPDVP